MSTRTHCWSTRAPPRPKSGRLHASQRRTAGPLPLQPQRTGVLGLIPAGDPSRTTASTATSSRAMTSSRASPTHPPRGPGVASRPSRRGLGFVGDLWVGQPHGDPYAAQAVTDLLPPTRGGPRDPESGAASRRPRRPRPRRKKATTPIRPCNSRTRPRGEDPVAHEKREPTDRYRDLSDRRLPAGHGARGPDRLPGPEGSGPGGDDEGESCTGSPSRHKAHGAARAPLLKTKPRARPTSKRIAQVSFRWIMGHRPVRQQGRGLGRRGSTTAKRAGR